MTDYSQIIQNENEAEIVRQLLENRILENRIYPMRKNNPETTAMCRILIKRLEAAKEGKP